MNPEITQDSGTAVRFEEKMKQLTAITEQLEKGGLPLAEAVALYGEGAKLAAACRAELDAAKLAVSVYAQENQEAESAGSAESE